MLRHSRLFSAALAVLLAAGRVAAAPSVALLPFHATPEMDTVQVQRLASAYYHALARKPGINLLSAAETDRRFDATAYNTSESAARAAAKTLGVDYVVFGTVRPEGTRSALETGVLGAANGKLLGRSLTAFTKQDSVTDLAAQSAGNLLRSSLPAVGTWALPVAGATVMDLVDAPDSDMPKRRSQQRQRFKLPTTGFAAAIAGRLEVGTRMGLVQLSDESPGPILGTISDLEARQNMLPWRVFADWYWNTHWGVELGWDAYAARALTTPFSVADGEFTLRGPVAMLLGRYPNSSRWTPYGGLGLALFKGGFEGDTWWANGFNSPQEWFDAGAPDSSLSGVTQTVRVDDPVAIVWHAGCLLQLRGRWSGDVYLRHTDVDMDIRHEINSGGTLIQNQVTKSSVDLSNTSYGLGVRYAF